MWNAWSPESNPYYDRFEQYQQGLLKQQGKEENPLLMQLGGMLNTNGQEQQGFANDLMGSPYQGFATAYMQQYGQGPSTPPPAPQAGTPYASSYNVGYVPSTSYGKQYADTYSNGWSYQ